MDWNAAWNGQIFEDTYIHVLVSLYRPFILTSKIQDLYSTVEPLSGVVLYSTRAQQSGLKLCRGGVLTSRVASIKEGF